MRARRNRRTGATGATLFVLLALLPGAPRAADAPSRRPNILLIVADDLGYSDLGSYGSEIATPNLDALARDGLRFTNFHAHMLCTPSRVNLLTGVDNHRAGFGNMRGDTPPEQQGKPGYEEQLNDRVVTIAELLHEAGYFTAMTGKWDLGPSFATGPDRRGFEQSFVLMQGTANNFEQLPAIEEVPVPFYRENGWPVGLPADFYSSATYTDRLIGYLEDDRATGRPFFAYLAFTAPHWPLQAPDEFLARQRGRYADGYAPIARARLEKMRALGIVGRDVRPAPLDAVWPAWETLAPAMKDLETRRMQVYAAMVEALDHHVGRMLDYLRRSGQLEHTFVLFLSDNGAEPGNPLDWGWYPWAERLFDLRPARMGQRGSYVWYGPGWAHVSSTPWRLGKGFSTEGGLRVPAIVRDPRHLGRGALTHARVSALDVVPTLLEVAGVPAPGPRWHGREVYALEGRSFTPLLGDPRRELRGPRDALVYEIWNRRAVLEGDWKLVWMPAPWGRGLGQWSLYNVRTDPTELDDVADRYPERVQALRDRWQRYVDEHGVIVLDWFDVAQSNQRSHYDWLPPSVRGTPPGSYNVPPWSPARPATGPPAKAE